jgi:FkbM family methyltransferase
MKFYGQFRPPVDQVLFERYGEELGGEPGYFVESGAFDGQTECNCKFLEESLGWTGVNVEPFPHHFRKLVRNRPRSINWNCALSSHIGRQTFHHVAHPRLGDDFGNGSLAHTPEHKAALRQDGCTFHDIDVPILTYDAVVRASGLPRVDLFSLDVEGHELAVLDGMHDPALLPRLLCVETGHDRDQAIHWRLTEMGFVKDGEYLVNSFYRRAA